MQFTDGSGFPLPEQVVLVAKQKRGGENESELRLDRLSARAKQAGLATNGA
jgi:hypothetical protein